MKTHIQEDHPEEFSQQKWEEGEEKRKKEKSWNRQMILLDTFGYELPSGKRNFCPVCDKSWSDNRLSSLKDHLQRVHPNDFNQEIWNRGLEKRKLKDIQNRSKAALTGKNSKLTKLPGIKCPFCNMHVTRKHLKNHLKKVRIKI